METVIKLHFRIEAGWSRIAPIRFFGEQPSVPVVINFSITAWKEEQGAPPGFLVKNEYFGVRISLRHLCCSGEGLLVSFSRITFGVVIEVVAVAVNDEYH
ncbi:MAG: hypothetical protein SCK70_04515 [bacterium]|nr:hypothetical protein [bacterium]